jgi:EAL domain-containing protein (putative c-di-GMP-specific phosphodiesterase class I)
MCQSGCRRLVLFAPDLSNVFPELAAVQPGDGWELSPERDAVQATLGPDYPWQTTRELVNFLRTVIDDDRLDTLQAAWLPECGSLQQQQTATIRRNAQPVTSLAPLDASPLTELLDNRRIETWYQPVLTSHRYALWGYECLMRGRDARGELIPPGQIFDWARQEQLTFMLDRVCRETHLLNAGAAAIPDHARLLVNFLPTTVYDPQFCLRTTVRAAERAGIAPERVVFEVVESDKVEDHEHLLSILAYYRNAGFSVALDDVGTGYSGLMMLAEMNPDLIKIDRALVTRAPESRLHQGICRSLVELAAESGKLSLAEGVETEQQRRLMESLGVDLFQGFLFGEPSPEPAGAAQTTSN